MSETINYYGEAHGITKEEAESLKKVIEESDLLDEAEVEIHPDFHNLGKFYLWFDRGGGRRGGGSTCEELLTEVFGQWAKDHPNVELKTYATYVDSAPQEEITFKGEEVCNHMVL